MIDRLLIAGLGSIGRRHARIVRELLPDISICALRHSQDAPELDGVESVYSLGDALALQPDAAVIATPASTHIDVSLPLARAGVHLLIEKPISSSSSRVEELIAASQTGGSVLLTGYNLRFSSSLQRLNQLVREARVGRILSIRAEVGQYLPDWRPDADYRKSVSARAELGGGVLLELSHEIDYLRWLFGDVEWVSAALVRQSDLDIDVEDIGHLTLAFSGASSPVAVLNLDFVRHDTTRTCTVIGTQGTLRWNALTGQVHVFEKGSGEWALEFEAPANADETYKAEWRHFLGCIEGEAQASPSGLDGLAVLNIVDAARQSAETGKRTTVERACHMESVPGTGVGR